MLRMRDRVGCAGFLRRGLTQARRFCGVRTVDKRGNKAFLPDLSGNIANFTFVAGAILSALVEILPTLGGETQKGSETKICTDSKA